MLTDEQLKDYEQQLDDLSELDYNAVVWLIRQLISDIRTLREVLEEIEEAYVSGPDDFRIVAKNMVDILRKYKYLQGGPSHDL